MTRQVVDIPADSELFVASRDSFTRIGYSPAVIAGGLMFISGQIARRVDGSIADEIVEQVDLVFKRTAEILRWKGLNLGDVVELVSYHVDVTTSMQPFLEAKARYVQAPFPAWTAVGVPVLGNPKVLIELRSVAALRV